MWALGSWSNPDVDWKVVLVCAGCWFGFIWDSSHSECTEAVGLWAWCAVFSVFGFRHPTLADLDCLLLLEWIKCATDRGRGSAVTRWVELSASCCLYLVKTGGDLISPGSHKLDRSTCCPDPLMIFLLPFKGVRKICTRKKEKNTPKKLQWNFNLLY